MRLSRYCCGTAISGSADCTRMPSSSSSSRASACAGVSPGSTLPPGNSQAPARSRPAVRRASSTRPRASSITPATTCTSGCLCSSPFREGRGGRNSGELSMTLLEFLARTARARVVAADLRREAAGGREHSLPLHRQRLRLLRFLVDAEAAGVGMLELHAVGLRLHAAALVLFQLLDLVLAADAHARQHRGDVALDLVEQLGEQLEALALVFLLRLLLRVAAQVDALAQVVHARQVLLPALVEHVEHQVLLELAHDLRTDRSLLLVEVAGRRVEHVLHELGIVQFVVARLDQLGHAEADAVL